MPTLIAAPLMTTALQPASFTPTHVDREDRAQRLQSAAVVLAAIVWGIGVVAGSGVLWRFASTPGPVIAAPTAWPAASALPRQAGRSTLVMFAHPRCPCTRASLGELSRLMAASGDQLVPVIAFIEPHGTPPDWSQTDLWRSAAAIPGSTVVRDLDGAEARRFGARTSGDVLVYDASGRLAFQGGLTPARGHEGASAGQSAILAFTKDQTAAACAPTFGCPLCTPPTDSARGE